MQSLIRHLSRMAILPLSATAAFGGSAAAAASLTTLYSFGTGPSGSADASNPHDGLVRDAAGNLYGTSFAGGAGFVGAVFELSPPAAGQTVWTETVIHSFSYPRGVTDGAQPQGALTLGSKGVLYGTTAGGGGAGNDGGGTIYSLTPPGTAGAAWKERTLSVLPAPRGVAARPVGSLVLDAAGNLYGVTMFGGNGAGILFEVSPPAAGETAWKRTTLHTFAATGPSGQQPSSGLIADASGALYGSTIGTSASSVRAGTVFQLAPPAAGQTAWTYVTIYGFPSDDSRGSGIGELELDASGAIYGVAAGGGSAGSGDVFRLTPPANGAPAWTASVIRAFPGGVLGVPEGGVVSAGTGVLLGTTAGSTSRVGGEIYELMSPSNPTHVWSEQTLAQFITQPAGGGSFPVGSLVSDGSGHYFGATASGGAGGDGTVFEVTP